MPKSCGRNRGRKQEYSSEIDSRKSVKKLHQILIPRSSNSKEEIEINSDAEPLAVERYKDVHLDESENEVINITS